MMIGILITLIVLSWDISDEVLVSGDRKFTILHKYHHRSLSLKR